MATTETKVSVAEMVESINVILNESRLPLTSRRFKAARDYIIAANGVTRVIDGKFVVKGGQIVKASSGEIVPEDEPLVLMRGRDHLMVATLNHYRRLCQLDGCNEFQLGLVDELIAKFVAYASDPSRMKQPGVTRGAAWKPDAQHVARPTSLLDQIHAARATAIANNQHALAEWITKHADEACPAAIAHCSAKKAVDTLVTALAEANRERDLAIAHDRQPYPTAWAYEQACAVLRRREAEVAALTRQLETAKALLLAEIKRIEDFAVCEEAEPSQCKEIVVHAAFADFISSLRNTLAAIDAPAPKRPIGDPSYLYTAEQRAVQVAGFANGTPSSVPNGQAPAPEWGNPASVASDAKPTTYGCNNLLCSLAGVHVGGCGAPANAPAEVPNGQAGGEAAFAVGVSANGTPGVSVAELPPESERCGVTFYVTVPPGVTKPTSRCINRKPCPIEGHSSDKSGGEAFSAEEAREGAGRRVYLAARYARHEELSDRANDLRNIGYDVQAEWITGVHHDTDSAECARIDFAEVAAADIVISFTEGPGEITGRGRGGRHVEFGIALALGKRCIVAGPRENVFHHMPQVEHYDKWQSLYAALLTPETEGK